MKSNGPEPFKIAILEKDNDHAIGLKNHILSMGQQVFGLFKNGEKFFTQLDQKGQFPDLLLLETSLSGQMNGLQVARKIKKDYHFPVIFIPEFVEEDAYPDILSVRPCGVLVKPVHLVELELSIHLAMACNAQKTKRQAHSASGPEQHNGRTFFFIKVNGTYRKLHFDEILWVEGSGSYTEITTLSGGLTVAKNLKDLETAINHASLVRIHRSYMVNIDHVSVIKGDTLVVGQKSLPLSRNGKQLIRELYNLI